MAGSVRTLQMQKLTFLGTCSAVPTKLRNMSGSVLSWDDGSLWLFDCGEGTQHRFLQSPLSHARITKIFITHMHGDHCFGLPGLMCTMASGAKDKVGDEEMTESDVPENLTCAQCPDDAPPGCPVVDIYGPFSLGHFIRTSLRLSHSLLSYRFRIHELLPPFTPPSEIDVSLKDVAHPNELLPRYLRPSDQGCYELLPKSDRYPSVQAALLTHVPGVFCVGYCMTEAPRPGQLDVQKLKQLGVPAGPMYGRLKSGQTVQLENGQEIQPQDVLGPQQAGRRVVILGDTCESSNLLPIGSEPDVLVHEATYSDDSAHLAGPRGHSTARMAGVFAKKLRAKQLVLTHFSARFSPSSSQVHSVLACSPETATHIALAQAEREAQALNVRPLVEQAMEGFGSDQVIAAHDFMEINLTACKASTS